MVIVVQIYFGRTLFYFSSRANSLCFAVAAMSSVVEIRVHCNYLCRIVPLFNPNTQKYLMVVNVSGQAIDPSHVLVCRLIGLG